MGYHYYRELYYTTSTIVKWSKIIEKHNLYDILLNAISYLVQTNKIIVYSFVIMPNHIHWIYQIIDPKLTNNTLKHSFLSFTSKQIILRLGKDDLRSFYVNKNSRKYQIWKAKSLSVELFSKKFLYQKVAYIHNNPIKGEICDNNGRYPFSSLNSYLTGIPEFNFLTLKLRAGTLATT